MEIVMEDLYDGEIEASTGADLILVDSTVLFFVLFSLGLQHLYCNENEFPNTLVEIRADVITISGVLAGIILTFLTSKALQIRQERLYKLQEFKELTFKVNNFRTVVHILIWSNIWKDGLKKYVDSKYGKISYYDVEDINSMNPKVNPLVLEFINDTEYGGKKLYLELKCFIIGKYSPDKTLFPVFESNKQYKIKDLKKWAKYNCGKILVRYFYDDYHEYKEHLRLDLVTKDDKESITKACINIDKERFRKMEFGNELISELGVCFTRDILPRLLRLQMYLDTTPKILIDLYLVNSCLICFGILLPLATKIFDLGPISDAISLSFVTTTCFYILVSFWQTLRNTIRVI